MKVMRSAVLAGVCVSAALSSSEATSPTVAQSGEVITGIVAEVYDGDGLWFEDGDGNRNTNLAVRLFGINAPEMKAPGGQAAKKFLSQRIKGRHARCAVQKIDSYHRPVAVCADAAGKDLSCAVVWAGHAVPTEERYYPCDRRRLPPSGPPPF